MSDDLELEDEESEDEETEVAAPQSAELPPEVRKHMDRQSRRIEKLQRDLADSKIAAYPESVRAIVQASGLPPTKWGDFAETVKAQLPVEPPAQTDQAAEVGAEATEDERQLAAVSDGPPAGAGAPDSLPTAAQIGELMKTNPAEGVRLQNLKLAQRAT